MLREECDCLGRFQTHLYSCPLTTIAASQHHPDQQAYVVCVVHQTHIRVNILFLEFVAIDHSRTQSSAPVGLATVCVCVRLMVTQRFKPDTLFGRSFADRLVIDMNSIRNYFHL